MFMVSPFRGKRNQDDFFLLVSIRAVTICNRLPPD